MISIVVPAYNASAVIERCINTVLQQTYSDFELLIIDDGSKDETAEIVATKATQDARIRLIRQENAGVSSARNTGIAAATGELLCFIDSDDTVSANYLETLLMLYSPGVLPVIDVVRSDFNGSALSPMPEKYTLDENWVDSYFCGQIRYGIAFSVWNKLYSMQTIRENSISFNPILTIGEDMIFVFQYLHYCKEIRFSNTACYFYTILHGSAMSSRRDYSTAYQKVFSILTDEDQLPSGVSQETLSKWAFDAIVVIMSNPFIYSKSYRDFKQWWITFKETTLYSFGINAEMTSSIKLEAFSLALRSGKASVVYMLLRLLKLKMQIWGAAY